MDAELAPLTSADVALASEAERARLMPLMHIGQALERREVIAQAFAKLLKDGDDYGKIGNSKPTLLQPGAQKLDNLFGLVARFEILEREEDWTGEGHSGEPFFRYMIRCQLLRNDFVMGEAIGECNSWEQKYRYRNADRKCPSCGKPAIIFTKKGTFWCAGFKGGCGSGFKKEDERITKQETGKVPNPDICDQVNTFLKMAQKRAHVGATINATSASEFFTQDLEDKAEGETTTTTEAEPVADTRPVPEELLLFFKRIDSKDNTAIKEAFAFLEKECAAVDGTNGLEEFKRATGFIRSKYPSGSIIPIPELKRCMIDIWQWIEKNRAGKSANGELNWGITDDDVPF